MEEKARKVVRQAFNDYLDAMRLNSEDSQYWYRIYAIKMEMLNQLFPNTTNEDQLERTWYAIWKKGQ